MAEIRQSKKHYKKVSFDEAEPQKLWLIPQIYGWLIVVIGFTIFLMLVIAAIAYVYETGLSFNSLFSLIQLAEGVGIGGGFIAFGTALRRLVIVQATLCVILLLITVWFVVILSIYSDWISGLESLGIGISVIAPLGLCVFLNRKQL